MGSQGFRGKDYLYWLGKEADSMNIAVGARAGVIDPLFLAIFLAKTVGFPAFLPFLLLNI